MEWGAIADWIILGVLVVWMTLDRCNVYYRK